MAVTQNPYQIGKPQAGNVNPGAVVQPGPSGGLTSPGDVSWGSYLPPGGNPAPGPLPWEQSASPAPSPSGGYAIGQGGGSNLMPIMNAPPSPRPNAAMNPYQPPAPMGPQGSATGSAIGGVSAVNPQAGQMDYDSLQPFIDSAYNSAMTKLQPQIDQSRDRFDQNMINRGMGVGNEGYNKAFQQQEGNINDALTNAAFGAMGFGTGIQNQMFGQDLGRSQLANSLLQAQWGKDLGYAGLGEQGRQFDLGLGERGRQFDLGLGENARQFNDSSNRAWDAQGFGQMMGLEGIDFRNRGYNDSRSDYSDALMMALLGMQAPGGQYNYDPNSPYASQLGYGSNTYGTWMSQFANPFLFGQGGIPGG